MQILSFANRIRGRYIPCISLKTNPDVSFTFMKGKKKKKKPSIKQACTDMQGHVRHFEQHTNVTMICRHRIIALRNLNSWKFDMQPLQLYPHKH